MALPVALQLFSVRDLFDKDPITTLKRIKEAGYDGIEPAGFYGMSPDYLRGLCDAIGLKIISIHLSYYTLSENIEATIGKMKTYGVEYVALPYNEGRFCGTELFADCVSDYTKLGKAFRDAGIGLLYHNHTGEFDPVNGDSALDVFFNSFDPDIIQSELDVCWVKKTGNDPVSYIRKYKNRIPVVHLKDYVEKEDFFSTCPFGDGTLDAKGIIEAAAESGSKWLVVEQDALEWEGMDSVECAEKSLQNIRKYNI